MGYFDDERAITLKDVVLSIDELNVKLSAIDSTLNEMESFNKYQVIESVNAIKAHAHSADHGVWNVLALLEIIPKKSGYQLVQTVLLAVIAWKLF